MSGPTLGPCSAREWAALHQLEVACPRPMPLTAGWRFDGEKPNLPGVLTWMASPKTLAWPASLPTQLLHPRTTSTLHSTGVCVCVWEKEPTLLSHSSPPGLPQTPEGTQIRVSPSPLRTSLAPKPQHCASYLPSPEILNQCGKLCSLFRVAQARLFHDVSSEEVPLPETFGGIRTESMTLALNWTVLSCGYPGRPVWDQPRGSPGSS